MDKVYIIILAHVVLYKLTWNTRHALAVISCVRDSLHITLSSFVSSPHLLWCLSHRLHHLSHRLHLHAQCSNCKSNFSSHNALVVHVFCVHSQLWCLLLSLQTSPLPLLIGHSWISICTLQVLFDVDASQYKHLIHSQFL